jgi:hypothetical protein
MASSIAGTRSDWRERLGQIRHGAGVPGTLDQLALGERGEDHDRCDLRGDDLGRRVDPVLARHLHVEDDEVGPQLGGQPHGLLAVAGLADDLIALLGEHLREVESDQRLVLGDHHGAGRRGDARLGTWQVIGAGYRFGHRLLRPAWFPWLPMRVSTM